MKSDERAITESRFQNRSEDIFNDNVLRAHTNQLETISSS